MLDSHIGLFQSGVVLLHKQSKLGGRPFGGVRGGLGASPGVGQKDELAVTVAADLPLYVEWLGVAAKPSKGKKKDSIKFGVKHGMVAQL